MGEVEFVTFEFLKTPPKFTPREAVELSRRRAKRGATKCAHGQSVIDNCGHNVACNYGYSALGLNTAADIWSTMPKKYKHEGLQRMLKAPRGAVLVWTGGTHGFGHAGISDGKGGVFCTDFPVPGHYGRVPINDITTAAPLLVPAGWTFPYFPLGGADNRKPPKVKPPEKDVKHTPNIDAILQAQADTIAAAKRAIVKRDNPDADKALRQIITMARKQLDLARPLHLPRPDPPPPAAKKAAAKKAPAKKAGAKKAPAKKAAAAKAPAKKAAAKTAAAAKTTAKKSPAKKTAAKRSTAKKVSG